MSGMLTLEDGSTLDLSAWPLPDGLDDGVLNRTLLGRAFDVSENTISKWVLQGMPVEEVGGNGSSYSFRLSHCWAWRKQREETLRFEKEQAESLAQQAAMAFLNLGSDADEGERGLSAKAMKELAEADYQRNRAAELRGELVRASRVQALFEDLIVQFRVTMDTLPDWAEAEFGLTPRQVDAMQKRCDQVLIEAKHAISEHVLQRGEIVAGPGAQADLGV